MTQASSNKHNAPSQQENGAPTHRRSVTVDVSLPWPTTSFFGRKQEMAQLDQMLKNSNCRLITLLGPGGIGKTRLALQAAMEHQSDYADGVALVSLVNLANIDEIASAVLSTLDPRPAPVHESQDQWAVQMRARHMLLVLDNFEHLAGDAKLLTQLMYLAPNVQMIVTSRTRLHLQHEWVFEVDGLDALPAGEIGGITSPHSSAVELFVQRARQARSTLDIGGTADLAYIVRICQAVRCMPLAIELAASWVRVLSVQEILQEIERNVTVLATVAPDVALRHRSIDAVFEHSWRLLSPEEQRLFARLSIFRGSFTRDAAGKVVTTYLSLSFDGDLKQACGTLTGATRIK